MNAGVCVSFGLNDGPSEGHLGCRAILYDALGDAAAAGRGADSQNLQGPAVFVSCDEYAHFAGPKIYGSYYFPSNHMALGGDATKFGNQFVVHTLEVFGNGNLEINYEGGFPAPGSDLFLVR